MNSSVSTIQKAERETTINFSVEIVKEAINTILEELPFKYSPVGKGKSNDVFNNYQFSISRMQLQTNLRQIVELHYE